LGGTKIKTIGRFCREEKGTHPVAKGMDRRKPPPDVAIAIPGNNCKTVALLENPNPNNRRNKIAYERHFYAAASTYWRF